MYQYVYRGEEKEMVMKTKRRNKNKKVKRKSAGTNKGTSGMQAQHYASLWMRGLT